jgi:hypothetical protein
MTVLISRFVRGIVYYVESTSRSNGGILAGLSPMVFRKIDLYCMHILRIPACNSASPSIIGQCFYGRFYSVRV